MSITNCNLEPVKFQVGIRTRILFTLFQLKLAHLLQLPKRDEGMF